MNPQVNTSPIKSSVKRFMSLKKKEMFLGILFASPAILGFLIFILGPMVASLILSFTDYAIVNNIKFIGLKNYTNLFDGTDVFFYKSLGVTFYYVLLSVPLDIIFSFFMAILLNQDIKGKGLFRTIYYLPNIVPAVASSVIWLWLLDPSLGIINSFLSLLHLPTSKWLSDESTVMPSLVLMSLWTVGNSTLIFLAGLQGVPRQFYEAIEVDGGNWFNKFVHITIPMMTPVIFFNLTMGLIRGFQVFTPAYVMTAGGPNNASLFYVLYLFRQAFTFQKMGSASAIAWILFSAIMIFTVSNFVLSRKWVYYEGADDNK